MEGFTDNSALVHEHLPLVKRIAYHMMSRLPASVEVDDLIQAGLIGLLDAIERFDDEQSAHFETYASQRIRGAMLDELREADWASRHVRKASRDIEKAIHTLQQKLQRPPSEGEIAEVLGLEINDYYSLLNETSGAQLVYYEDLHNQDGDGFLEHVADNVSSSPFDSIASDAFKKSLIQAITMLPEREKHLMGMYYEQGLNFKEIGAVLDVNESRVSQLHSQAISRLRSRLREWR